MSSTFLGVATPIERARERDGANARFHGAGMRRETGAFSRPVIVGVTGHRDLGADDPVLAQLVVRQLGRIARANGNAPLLILSGLAEGADRLVVDAARGALGGTYWAILPLPDVLYARDFATAASRTAYKALKEQAERVIAAPLMASRRSLAASGEPRNHQYAWTGAYIAKRAQVLLAMWDGAPARGTGGTAHVVDWYLADTAPRAYRISQAPRIAGRDGVAEEFVHINPETGKVGRIARRRPSAARR